MKNRTVHYEPHPVSKERKAELLARGLQIIDAKFAPPAAKVRPTESPAPQAVKRGPTRQRKETQSTETEMEAINGDR